MGRQAKPPPELVDALKSERMIAIVGSGLSAASHGPSWEELLFGIAAGIEETRPDRILDLAYAVEAIRNNRLLDAADLMKEILGQLFPSQILRQLRFKREGLKVEDAALRLALGNERIDSLFVSYRPEEPRPALRPNPSHWIIGQLPFRAIITTNYDKLLEEVRPDAPHYSRSYPELPARVQDGRFFVLKLHGGQDHPEDLVLARSEFQAVRNDERLRAALQGLLQNHQTLWIGYGHQDPHLDGYLDWLAPLGLSGGFALVRASDRLTLNRLKSVAVSPWVYHEHEEIPDLLRLLAQNANVKLSPVESPPNVPSEPVGITSSIGLGVVTAKLQSGMPLSAAEMCVLLEAMAISQRATLTGLGTNVPSDHGVVGAESGVTIGGTTNFAALATERLTFGEVGEQAIVSAVGQPSKKEAELLSRYLNRLIAEKSPIDLTGIVTRPANAESRAVELSALYVALDTLRCKEEIESAKLRLDRESPGGEERVSALELISSRPCVTFLGDPGSGKTTFANFLTACLAGELLQRSDLCLERMGEAWKAGPLLPLAVTLRDFAACLQLDSRESEEEQFWTFLEGHFGEKLLGLADYLRAHFESRGGMLILDGFDEVPEAHQRRLGIQNCVRQLRDRFPRCKILITCRTYAYERQDWRIRGFEAARLAPFSEDKVGAFVDGWYSHLGQVRQWPATHSQGKAERLKEAIWSNPCLRRLSSSPLLLTLMAALHAWGDGELPDGKDQLYEQSVHLLLEFWERSKEVVNPDGSVTLIEQSAAAVFNADLDRIRHALEELSYNVHRTQKGTEETAEIEQSQLVASLLRVAAPGTQHRQVIQDVSYRAGLLVPKAGEIYSFPHRSFQAYLAACHLTRDWRWPQPLAELTFQDPDRWREVFWFAAARASREYTPHAWSLLRGFLPDVTVESEGARNSVWKSFSLAGQLLLDTGLHLPEDLDSEERELVSRLVSGLCLLAKEGRLPPLERAVASEVLGRLGDPRPGVGLDLANGVPEIDWIDIDGGPFWMGDKESWEGGRKFQMELAAFRIARYPVTVAQYAAFIQAGGYREKRFWTELGWKLREEDGWTGPYSHSAEYEVGNVPRTGVSWYEAVAYCRWLTDTLKEVGKLELDWEVSAPTEAQWERAARSTDGRRYTWGGQGETDTRCNMADTGIGRPTAVGIFPSGNAECEAADMAGNVWEWCRTQWFEDYSTYEEDLKRGVAEQLDGEVRRALRGGAFAHNRGLVRCAARNRYYPDLRRSYIGFRLASSPLL